MCVLLVKLLKERNWDTASFPSLFLFFWTKSSTVIAVGETGLHLSTDSGEGVTESSFDEEINTVRHKFGDATVRRSHDSMEIKLSPIL